MLKIRKWLPGKDKVQDIVRKTLPKDEGYDCENLCQDLRNISPSKNLRGRTHRPAPVNNGTTKNLRV